MSDVAKSTAVRQEISLALAGEANGYSRGKKKLLRAADYFSVNTFNDRVMREKLSKETYQRLNAIIKKGEKLDQSLANEVAHAMKEWALERGVTHFTHWFQPMTGLTAEKHDAFLEIDRDGQPLSASAGTS